MNLIEFIIHIDVHLGQLIEEFGVITYLIIFLIVFCETGLVVTPFLPGDSLLFAAGAMAALKLMHIKILILSLGLAALSGDQVNYWIGRNIGHLLIKMKDSWYFKKAYLKKTHNYYEQYGGKTLVIARFVPIVRTFAPFIAGLSEMTYWRFCLFSICGGIFWIASLSLLGYLFGNIPLVKNNFMLVI